MVLKLDFQIVVRTTFWRGESAKGACQWIAKEELDSESDMKWATGTGNKIHGEWRVESSSTQVVKLRIKGRERVHTSTFTRASPCKAQRKPTWEIRNHRVTCHIVTFVEGH
jgi:hypothetical protein